LSINAAFRYDETMMSDEPDLMENNTEAWIHKYATDVVAEATGGNASHIEKLSYRERITRNDVLNVLRAARVPLARELLSDIEQIFDGEEPRYFISHDRVVDRYRENHHPNIDFTERDYGIRPLVNADVIRQLNQDLSELQDFGVSLAEYREGAACLAEQEFFYETEEWKDRATVIRIMDRFTCRICGGNEMLEVHHGEYIYSVFSRRFYHNFDVVGLRCLCDRCHRAFHESHVRGDSCFNSCFKSADREEISRHRKYRVALERLHDAARECRFCFSEHRKAA